MGELIIILRDCKGQITGELALNHKDSVLAELFDRAVSGLFTNNSSKDSHFSKSSSCKCESTSKCSNSESKTETLKIDQVRESKEKGAIRNDLSGKPRNMLALSDKKILLREGSTGFITQKCPHCDHVCNGLTSAGSEIKCYNCGDTFKTPDKLVKIDYVCPYCDSKGYGYTPENQDINTIHCKECKVPVDIVYVEKFGKFISANLAK